MSESQIESLCDRFDAAWSEGKPLKIVSLLRQVPKDKRVKLLKALLEIEFEYRLNAGESPDVDAYADRFKGHRNWITDSLRAAQDRLNRDQSTELAPPDLSSTGALAPRVSASGRKIGPYKLLQQIGEGGMGTVYMAEQREPIRRRVALKVIRSGIDRKDVISRFEAERQALAMMDHQNIAKVLDVKTGQRVDDEGWRDYEPDTHVSADGRWLALPSGDDVLLVDREFKNTPEEQAYRERISRIDPQWHDEQAVDAIQRADWYAAAFHIARIPDFRERAVYRQYHAAIQKLSPEQQLLVPQPTLPAPTLPDGTLAVPSGWNESLPNPNAPAPPRDKQTLIDSDAPAPPRDKQTLINSDAPAPPNEKRPLPDPNAPPPPNENRPFRDPNAPAPPRPKLSKPPAESAN